jgi:hypothetical protein
MNTKTQKLVFSKISKQNLGLIEDAINVSKDQFTSDVNELSSYNTELSQLINDIYNQIESLKPQLENLLSEKSKYNDLYYKLEDQEVELSEFGIDFGMSGNVWGTLKDDFGYTIDAANYLKETLSTFSK